MTTTNDGQDLWSTFALSLRAEFTQKLRNYRPNLGRSTGVLPGRNLPTTGNTGSGYTPTDHASSHQHGGGDEIATATPGADDIPKAEASGKLNDGWLSSAIARVADLASYLLLSDVTTTPTASKVPRANADGVLAPGWTLIKQSVDTGETVTIPAGYAHTVPKKFKNAGKVRVAGLFRVG